MPENESANQTEPPEKEVAQATFRAPGKGSWMPVFLDNTANDSDGTKRQKIADELKNVLLESLQMQHLVVLAGSGCSYAAGVPSMYDLWKKAVGEEPTESAKDIAQKVRHDLTDKNIESFLSRIEAYLQVNEDAAVARFLDDSKRVILQGCSGFLDRTKLEVHQTFLHRLSRRRIRDPRLKLFTTNYDLCFERAASAIGGIALDGFSFTAPRQYDARYFGYDIIRRQRLGDDASQYLEGVFQLYKLHGSVNWARRGNDDIYEKESPEPSEVCLIYPAQGKYQQSFSQPYLEAIAHYLAAVREPNTCVLTIGFGFNDAHLTEPLLAATRSNPHLRLVVVDPAVLSYEVSSNATLKRLFNLADSGEDIWLISATFDGFSLILPDLRALTPANRLTAAIKDIAGRE